MDRDYWLGRWKRGETGWHQAEVEPELIRHFAALAPTRVLVPLCGKSLDLAWLASKGHEVVGVELSELAIREYFASQNMQPVTTREGAFQVFRGGGCTIFNGDFFELTSEQAGKVGAIYDRAALIALPPEMRARYARHLSSLVGNDFSFWLQLVLTRTPDDTQGPPFSISEQELQTLYASQYTVSPLHREAVESRTPGAHKTEQCVYRIAPRI